MKKAAVLCLLFVFMLSSCKQPSLDKDSSVENIETCAYTVNSSLPKYDIKIAYTSNKKEIATSLSLLEGKSSKEIQHINLKDNYRFTKDPIYIADITFDGYADVLIPYQRSASAQCFMAFVWDTATNKLIYAPTFENLSNVALDENMKAILSSRSADKTTSYSISVFDKETNDFKVYKSLYYYPDGDNIIYIEEKLENGTMQIVSEFKVPYSQDGDYSINPALKNYYNDKSDWELNSSKWDNFLISVSEFAKY